MKTKFEFRSNVGVVAGGDISSNVGEVHLYVNLDRPDVSLSIDEEQTQLVTQKVFSVARRSGVDTLRLTEILCTKFGLASISAMTVAEFRPVMAFLDGWETSFVQRSKTYTRPTFGGSLARLQRTMPFLKDWYVPWVGALLLCAFAVCIAVGVSREVRSKHEQVLAFPASPAISIPGEPDDDLSSTLTPVGFR
ncbi:hypothetical protein [Caballeronia sp. HLA56]